MTKTLKMPFRNAGAHHRQELVRHHWRRLGERARTVDPDPGYRRTGLGMDWAQLVSQVGFPIAVSAWLLVKLDDRLGAFEKTAVAICQRLEDQQNRCNECREWRQRNEKMA